MLLHFRAVRFSKSTSEKKKMNTFPDNRVSGIRRFYTLDGNIINVPGIDERGDFFFFSRGPCILPLKRQDGDFFFFLFSNDVSAAFAYRFDATKSTKGASKLRRDLINAEIANLRDLLPLPPSTRQRLSQLQLMALVCVYVRKANYFQQGKISVRYRLTHG